mmetsp:Transcript_18553/g.51743  ORF Transcript_18553/g.51743 Transcript_18553/m.51743 type:complete len:223 (+) Transcript_18553:97-765(+)
MAEKEPVPEVEEGEEEHMVEGEQAAAGGQDLYYISETAIADIKEKLGAGAKEDDIQPLLDKVTDPTQVDDDEPMLPVDMRGVGQEFNSIQDMVAALGVVGAAEAFVRAREYFEANHEGEPEDQRPQPMMAAEWKACLHEGEEEELLAEGEEQEWSELLAAEGGDAELPMGEGQEEEEPFEGEEPLEEGGEGEEGGDVEGENGEEGQAGEEGEEPPAKKAKTD